MFAIGLPCGEQQLCLVPKGPRLQLYLLPQSHSCNLSLLPHRQHCCPCLRYFPLYHPHQLHPQKQRQGVPYGLPCASSSELPNCLPLSLPPTQHQLHHLGKSHPLLVVLRKSPAPRLTLRTPVQRLKRTSSTQQTR